MVFFIKKDFTNEEKFLSTCNLFIVPVNHEGKSDVQLHITRFSAFTYSLPNQEEFYKGSKNAGLAHFRKRHMRLIFLGLV